MKKLRWQLLVVFLALVAIAILLMSQQQTLLPGVVAPAAAVVQPVSGGVYTEAMIGSLVRLNPALDYYNQADRDIDRLIFSSLMRFDDHAIPQGDLAETWGISEDGKVYNFSIRANAKWHDGQPVISDDFVFTIDLMRSDSIPLPADQKEFWNEVEIKALDDKTLQFRLPEPFAPFMDYLTFGVLPSHLLGDLLPEEIIESSFNLQPIGSGPYRFDRLLVTDGKIRGISLKANPEYYRSAPFLDEVVFQYYPDSSAALEAYRLGDVKGISQISPDQLSAALREPKLNLYTSRLPRLSLVYLNLEKPKLSFFQDPNLRRALLMGINRQRLIDRLLGGQAILAHGPIMPDSWAYYEGIEQLPYDPERAISIFKKAGYVTSGESGGARAKEGVSLSFEMVYPDTPTYTAIAESIRDDWQKIGVKANLKAVPYEDLVSDYLDKRNYEAALVDLNLSRSPDPDPYPFWHQAQAAGGQNYSQWNDRQASEYLEQARVEVDFSERARRYRNFQVRFTAEMPSLPLFFPVYTFGVDAEYKGVRVGPLYDPSDRLALISAWYANTRRTTAQLATETAAP